MAEAKGSKSKSKTKSSKPKTKSPKNTKPKTKSPKKKKSKQLPPSRRNEIWESLSTDDQSENPSSPTDVADIDEWSESSSHLKMEDRPSPPLGHRRQSSITRIDMSGSMHSSDAMDIDDDSSVDDDLSQGHLPFPPFITGDSGTSLDETIDVSDDEEEHKPAAEMSLKELKAELVHYGIPPENFLEKMEMIKAVKGARKREAKSNSRPEALRSLRDSTLRSRSVSIVSEASNNVTSGPLAGSNKFAKHDTVVYTSSNGTQEVATILKIHLDDELVPFYDIRLKDSGKEKQTDDAHLSPLPNRQSSVPIPDSIAFTFDDEEGLEGEFDLSVRSRSNNWDTDDNDYTEISHHSSPHRGSLSNSHRSGGPNENSTRSRRTSGQVLDNSTRSRRSSGPVLDNSTRSRRSAGPVLDTSARSRHSAASAPNIKRNSAQSPHQVRSRGRNSDFLSPRIVSSRRGSSNVSPTRPPRRSSTNVSPTRRRTSTNSPTRPASCRRRDSTDSYIPPRPGSTRLSPTRPPSCRRRDSTDSYVPPRPGSTRASTGRPASVRSSSPVPVKRPVSARHHSAPLSPVRPKKPASSKKTNLSPKRPSASTRKADLSPKRPKSVRTQTPPERPKTYGFSAKLLKKYMSS